MTLGIVPRHNRPLSRYAVRLFCLLRYGRSGAHAAEWWPWLHLTKPQDGSKGAIVYKDKVIAPLLPYPTLLGPRRELIVIGSGPSLSSQVTDRIPLESAVLLNGAIHLLGSSKRRPFAVVVEDERFVWRHSQALERLVPAGTDCYFSMSVIRALCETAPSPGTHSIRATFARVGKLAEFRGMSKAILPPAAPPGRFPQTLRAAAIRRLATTLPQHLD